MTRWAAFSRTIATGLAIACVCVAPASLAQEPSASDVSAARKLGTEGVKLANAGKCSEAIDRLERAEKLYHAVTILGRLGECQIAVGKIVEGTENLQRVVRETLPAHPPQAFVAAKTRAQKALDSALPKIAHLTIKVQAPRGVEYAVKVDDTLISAALVGESRPTDPGDHKVEASASDYLTATRSLTLSEGESKTVTLTLEPDPAAKKAKEPPPPKPAPPPKESSSTRKTLGYVSLGVGGAGLIVGSVFGLLALSKRNDLDDTCVEKVCDPSRQSDIDSARTKGTISTVGMVIGGVGLAAGVTLLLWPQAVEVKSAQATVRPLVGVGAVGLTGSF